MQKINYLYVVLIAICFAMNGYTQEVNNNLTDNYGKEKLLGIINKEALKDRPYQYWFNSEYHGYEVDIVAVQAIKKELEAFTIRVFMGTWCGDSRRELPRFYKVLEAADFNMDKLIVVALDNAQPNYKKSPGGEEKGFDIYKVPTFIFIKDGKEVNRIVEFPVVSLEQDITVIVKGKPYIPNYNNFPRLPVD